MLNKLKDIIKDLLDATAPELPTADDWKQPFRYVTEKRELYLSFPMLIGFILALAANFLYMVSFAVWAILNIPVALYRVHKTEV